MTDKSKVQGEGKYDAARSAVETARKALFGKDGATLKAAGEEGRSHAKR